MQRWQLKNMSKQLSEIPVSVLDLAPVAQGDSIQDSLLKSLALARAAEEFGYNRYWFAEHHNMENIASSATAVLIGFIAGGTKTLRVGSGGIMLPNHAPLMVAEQFGTLASLYPGRIDLGLGRAPGTDQQTSFALRRSMQGSVDSFPNDVIELQSYLGPKGSSGPVRAIPGEGTEVPIWLLGSSTYSARLAAALGLPFAFASHFAPAQLFDALRLYRESFQPSAQLKEPYAMACINVIASDTDEEAQRLATSFYRLALGIIRNSRKPLQPPIESMEGEWTEPERAAVKQMMQFSFIGSKETVRKGLQSFLAQTGVDEIMVASYIFDNERKIYSYKLVSELFQTK
jgi:luciferase family oxidoreductase group 1